jgi:hypothetical protein
MKLTTMTRRTAMASLAGASLARRGSADTWLELFDGKSLNGWKASENASSWRVSDGALMANGPRSHLFYTGPV